MFRTTQSYVLDMTFAVSTYFDPEWTNPGISKALCYNVDTTTLPLDYCFSLSATGISSLLGCIPRLPSHSSAGQQARNATLLMLSTVSGGT